MKTKQLLLRFVVFCFAISVSALLFAKEYTYKTVPNDPLKVREYTLDNGLKVFITVDKAEPRIQTYIAVRVGSKNDPETNTGLAHYFEHMMFKGTSNFGTQNWTKEKEYVQAITNEYEVYSKLTDSAARVRSYKRIDSLSYIASTLAIPNEYDKLMTAIGSTGTNAGTSYDFTNYIENIPSNQLENWAKIQSDRFSNSVLRLFHTEIETVYEEKNMSLTRDSRKMSEAMLNALFPNHPYGKATVLGSQEHLKNPSLKAISQFFDEYYVPNNYAIILAGDLNPDQAIALVDKYFGKLPSKEVKPFVVIPETPIAQPVVREVVGLEAESLLIGFRVKGAGTRDMMISEMIGSMLYNGQAGLYDLNLNVKQQVMIAYAYAQGLVDHGILTLGGMPKTGQSLEEVKNLMLAQLELLKKGEFPDWMLKAAIDNKKVETMQFYESLQGKGMTVAYTYLEGRPWEEQVKYFDVLSGITKEDIVKFANENFKDNYVVVYKRQGQPTDIVKMPKPEITPIEVNREAESDFLKEVKAYKPSPIEPEFLDYKTAVVKGKIGKNIELLYSKNTQNDLFELVYLFEMGSYNDKTIGTAFDYLPYLGTDKYTPEQIKQEFFKLACSFNANVASRRIYVSLSGLKENMEAAVKLFEHLVKNCQPNEAALEGLKMDLLKLRQDAKTNQNSNISALGNYGLYGKINPTTNILSNEDLQNLKAEDLIKQIKNAYQFEHQVLYYGPEELKTVQSLVGKYHKVPSKLQAVPSAYDYEMIENKEDIVYFVNYNAKQSYCNLLFKGEKYQKEDQALIGMFNSYFGGGMNAIVFQELREKRSLAYTAYSVYRRPYSPSEYYYNLGFIATQNDKVETAFDAFNDLYNNMPISQKSFDLAKESTMSDIRTQRIRKMDIIWTYLYDTRFGFDQDSRKFIYEEVQKVSMDDIKNFNETRIKGKKKTYVILGDEKDFDFEKLEKHYGKVVKLTQEDIFGY